MRRMSDLSWYELWRMARDRAFDRMQVEDVMRQSGACRDLGKRDRLQARFLRCRERMWAAVERMASRAGREESAG